MKLILTQRCVPQAGVCPFCLLDEQGHEITWANQFLDAQHIRQLSPRSLRAYAYDLLHFARWFQSQPHTLSEISESTLLEYVRHQLSQEPKPTPQTVNHRLTVIRCLYRFHHGQEIPGPACALSAHLHNALPGRLWPSPAHDGLRSPASSSPGASSSLYPQSKSLSFGRAFTPSGILPWWA